MHKWMIFFGFKALVEGRQPNPIYLRMVARPAS